MECLLDQLSEDKINLVVDNAALNAGGETSCNSSKTNSSKSSTYNGDTANQQAATADAGAVIGVNTGGSLGVCL